MALFAVHMVALGVSTQCAYIFHQPKLPDEVKKSLENFNMQKLAIRLTNYVVCKGVVKEEERKVYEYGFQTGLEVSLSFLISILIAALGHMLLEGLLFLAIFIPLRLMREGCI